MDLLERAKYKLKEQEAEKQEEIFVINKKLKDDKPIEIKDLNPPPKPPIPIKSSKIDFNKIANKAYFQRFIQNLMKDIMPNQFKGVDFRVSREVAAKLFDYKITEIERGSKGAFKVVVKELKERLAKQKVKVENGTN